MLTYFPKYFTGKSITLYIGVLMSSSLIFFAHPLPIIWWAFGLVEVISFFYFSNQLTRKWENYSARLFKKKIFTTALIIRIVWVVFSYVFYSIMTGQPFEFDAADSANYHSRGLWIEGLIDINYYKPYFDFVKEGYSDAGYPTYLGFLYHFTFKSILVVRLLKALYGALTCIVVYHLAVRNFGEKVGRMSAIFCMLMPNLILYTGLHLKEVEMVLLTVLFIERADLMLRNKNFNFIEIAPPVLIAIVMFFFRTVLAATAVFSLLTTLMFTSKKVVGGGKRIILIAWLLLTIGYFVGGRFSTEIEAVWQARQENQKSSMQWRTKVDNGNKFSKYISGSVFAPLILVIPFPTVVNTPGQQNQQIINGGNFVKNILAFFVMFALFLIIKNNKWRDFTLIGTFMIGYLLVIAMSAFAQSERFHQPAIPLELIFAAYGISLVTNKTKKYFIWYMIFIFFACIAWSWFKLAGRGMV